MTEARETELIVRWLRHGDSVSHKYWRQVVREAAEQAGGSPAPGRSSHREALTALLAERLRDGITGDSYVMVADSGLYRDLISAALDNVDWWVVARELIDEHRDVSRKTTYRRRGRRPGVSQRRSKAELV